MDITVAFHNVDHSLALKDYITTKTEKLSRFTDKNTEAHWIVDSDGKNFISRINILFKGKNITIHSKAKNAFAAASAVLAKTKNLLSRGARKGKFTRPVLDL